MALFKIFKGSSGDLANQNAHEGYAYFTPDDGYFYIDISGDGTQAAVVDNTAGPNSTVNRVRLRAAVAHKVDSKLTINGVQYDGATPIDVGTIGIGYGGTGKESWISDGVVYASASDALAQAVAAAGGAILITGTNTTTPSWLAAGTDGFVLKTQGSGKTPIWVNPNTLTAKQTSAALGFSQTANAGCAVTDTFNGSTARTLSTDTIGALNKAGGTMSGDILFSNSALDMRQIQFTVGTNDYARLAAKADAADDGWVEIATANDGTEPVYIRQYSGLFETIVRTLTLLDSTGNSTFPGTITASGFSAANGNLSIKNITFTGTITGLQSLTFVTTEGQESAAGSYNGNSPMTISTATINALNLAGGTMTGTLTLNASQNADTAATGALNANDSDIYNLNSIKFNDLSGNAAEGIQWYRDATHADSMWVNAGHIYFYPNRQYGVTNGSYYEVMTTQSHNSQLTINGQTYKPSTGAVTIDTLGIAYGGTGRETWTNLGLVYAKTNATTNNIELIQATAAAGGAILITGTTAEPTWLAAGQAYQMLQSQGTAQPSRWITPSFGIGTQTITVGQSNHNVIDMNTLLSDLGITQAFHYLGQSTTNPVTTGVTISDSVLTSFNAGDVVLYNGATYIYNGASWDGQSGTAYKTLQSAYLDTAATQLQTAGGYVVSSVEQNANGNITVNKVPITENNTVSTIVKRDASGDFSANEITATLKGNADSATEFSTTTTVALTGDATGTSTASKIGWSVPVTLANSGVTAGSYGLASNQTPDYGETFNVPYITVDAKGRITSASTKTVTIPSGSNVTAIDNLTSTSTTDCLSANMGRALANGDARDSTKVLKAGDTMTGALTTHGLCGTSGVDYGSTLPQSPSTGQLFFQFSDAASDLPSGGATGQALVKASNADYDYAWQAIGGLMTPSTTTKYYVSGSAYATENNSAAIFNTAIYVQSSVLYGAAWNDYAEYRETKEDIEPGRVVIEVGDGTLVLATERMQPGAEIVSDTFGFAIGQTEKCKTPIAVSGRVLAYPYEGIEKFKPGRPVCSGPNGTVSIMSDLEAKQFPWMIIGTVSSIPTEKTWGQNNIEVKNRIWIRVR